jgi:hypothetical protein
MSAGYWLVISLGQAFYGNGTVDSQCPERSLQAHLRESSTLIEERFGTHWRANSHGWQFQKLKPNALGHAVARQSICRIPFPKKFRTERHLIGLTIEMKWHDSPREGVIHTKDPYISFDPDLDQTQSPSKGNGFLHFLKTETGLAGELARQRRCCCRFS